MQPENFTPKNFTAPVASEAWVENAKLNWSKILKESMATGDMDRARYAKEILNWLEKEG